MKDLLEFKQYLFDKGLIGQLDFIKIKTLKEETNHGEKLLDGSLLDPIIVGRAMASFLGLEYLDTVSKIEMSDYLYQLDAYGAKSLNIIPVRLQDYTEAVIVTNPFDERVDDYIAKWYVKENKSFKLIVSSKPIVSSFYNRFSNIVDEVIKGTISIETRDEIKLLLRKIILDASAERVSDIRIFQQSGSGGITFRKFGDLYTYMDLTLDRVKRLQSSITNDDYTTFSDMNKEKPRVGHMRINLNGDWYELRVNIIPTVFGYDVNMRFIYIDYVDYECLGLSEKAQSRLLTYVNEKHGMILFTGPVGTGKSTTLYSVLEKLKKDKTICTAEDPVEHKIEGIAQVAVSKNVTYSMAIQSFLRHDPDVIVIGEIRSEEVAREAFIAAETGHLLLSSLHCKTALGVFSRLRDLGVSNSNIVDNVKCVVCQRLVKRSSGGRTLLVEILTLDTKLRRLIMENSQTEDLMSCLDDSNYISMLDELEKKLEDNEVTNEEVLKFLAVEGIT